MRQPWFCGVCGKEGRVYLRDRVGVWEGVQAILQAHRTASPLCGGSHVRVKAKRPRKARKA